MNTIKGKFEAIDSFMTFPDHTYGVIGDLKEGEVKAGYFLNIKLNSTLSISAKIDEMKEIQFSRFDEKHTPLLTDVTHKLEESVIVRTP
jgi:hypothetical protein